MKTTYETENGKTIRVKTYNDGRVLKLDEKGRKVYEKDRDDEGIKWWEWWYEYDDERNITERRRNDGFRGWYEYDSKGNIIHSWDFPFGNEEWTDFDEDGRITHIKNRRGFESWTDYNDDGSIMRRRTLESDLSGYKKWSEFDSKGKLLYVKVIGGNEWNTTYEWFAGEEIF